MIYFNLSNHDVQGLTTPFLWCTDVLASGYDGLLFVNNSDNSLTELDSTGSTSALFDIRIIEDSRLVSYNGQLLYLSDWVEAHNVDSYSNYTADQYTASYSEYFKEYTQSTHFEAGIVTPLYFAAMEYNKELVDVYSKTSESNFYASSSQAMQREYDMLLQGSAALIPWHPVFVSNLEKLIPHPTTEPEQAFWCTVFAAFRTHYVAKATCGGKLRIMGSTSSSYVKEYSYEVVQEQFSFYAQCQEAAMTYGADSSYLESQLSEEFLASAEIESYFFPSVTLDPSRPNMKEMDLWKEQSKLTPVVVDLELLPIYILLGANPQFSNLSSHWQAITDYYLTKGTCPTLAEMNL